MSIKNYIDERKKQKVCFNISGFDFKDIKKQLKYYERNLKQKKIIKVQFYGKIEYREDLNE